MKYLLALALAVMLSGCVTLNQIVSTVGAASTVYSQVSKYYADAPKTVYALKGGYDIVLTAVVTFKTTVCPSVASQPFCKTAIPALRDANHKALAVLNAAEKFVRTNPTLDASAVIAAAKQAVVDFSKTATDNGVKTNG